MSFAEKSSAVFTRDLFLKIWTIGTGIIIARILGPVSIGIWYILLMVPSYAEPFGRLKLDVASVYFLGKRKYKFGQVYFNLIVVSLLSSAVIVILFFWQKDLILVNLLKNNLSGNNLLYLMLAYIPFTFININYSYLFLSKEDVRGYNMVSIIPPVISSGLGIFLLMVLKWGVFSLVLAVLIGSIAATLYSTLRIKRKEKIIPCLNFDMLKEFLRFGWKLYISGIINHFQVYVSGILVAMYLLPSAVTFYQMGQQKALMLTMIAVALGTFLYPLVAKIGGSRGSEITAKACRISFFTLTLLAIIGALFIKPVVVILYGKDFLPQIFPFWILLPGVIFYGATSIISSYFLGKGKPEIILKLSFIPLIFQVSLCVILIPRLGILGAALAATLSYFMTGMFYIFVFSRVSKVKFRDIIIPRKEDIILIISFIKKRLLKIWPTQNQNITS